MPTVAFGFVVVLACSVVLWPVEVAAQSEIAGIVKDASGSVLPGVDGRSIQSRAHRENACRSH